MYQTRSKQSHKEYRQNWHIDFLIHRNWHLDFRYYYKYPNKMCRKFHNQVDKKTKLRTTIKLFR